MNNVIVRNWNSLVSKDDTVYFLGDFCFVRKKQEVVRWKEKLNGHIILIRGNHDNKDTRKVFRPECYDELAIQIGKYNCILAHRPLYPDYWDIPTRDLTNHFARKAEYEKYDFVISGHIHNLRLWTGNSLNVGVDVHDFRPISEATVLTFLEDYQQ
jgi:calcineurin-like phosphoesterase family protein